MAWSITELDSNLREKNNPRTGTYISIYFFFLFFFSFPSPSPLLNLGLSTELFTLSQEEAVCLVICCPQVLRAMSASREAGLNILINSME